MRELGTSAVTNFYMEVSKGKILGHQAEFVIGAHPDIGIGTRELIWDQGGNKINPTVPVDIFVSSTSASDNTGATAFITVLDENFNRAFMSATLNGQTQVQASFIGPGTQPIWIQSTIIVDVGAVGDVYVALSDTLTGGIPDDATKIQSKVIAGNNISRTAQYMIPDGFAAATMAVRGGTDDTTKIATIFTEITPFGQPKITSVEYQITPDFPGFDFQLPVTTSEAPFGQIATVLPSKSIIAFSTTVASNNTKVFFGTDLILIENDLIGT